jgi:hypothetical protein
VHQLSRDEEEDGLYELLIASGLTLALVLLGVTLKALQAFTDFLRWNCALLVVRSKPTVMHHILQLYPFLRVLYQHH